MIAPDPPATTSTATPAIPTAPSTFTPTPPLTLKPVPCSRCSCAFVWGDARGNWWCTACNPPAHQRQVRRKLELIAGFAEGVADADSAQPAGRWLEHVVEVAPPPPDPLGPPPGVDVSEWFELLPSPMTADQYRRAERLCLPVPADPQAGAVVVKRTEPAAGVVVQVVAATAAKASTRPAGKATAAAATMAKKKPTRRATQPAGTRGMFGEDEGDGVGV